MARKLKQAPRTAVTVTERLDAVDTLRGFALLWMTLYHFIFDLNNFGYLRADFYQDPFWTLQRTAILSLFLFCAGFGQAMAVQRGQGWLRFWRRWIPIAVCALLVSAGSALMFPNSFIYFGVLHGMAVMLVITRLSARWGMWLVLPGLLAITLPFAAAPLLAGSPWAETLNAPTLNWLGLITRKPVTEDYVPLLPWLGVVWLGVGAASWSAQRQGNAIAWRAPATLRLLPVLGRWSLVYYMVHQPVMIGALWLLRAAGT